MTKEQISDAFRGAKDENELKAIYIKLLRANHPDKGGDVTTCQLINAVYDDFRKNPRFGFSWSNESQDEQQDTTAVSPELYDVIMKVSSLEGVSLEICGRWLWIHDTEKSMREYLKAAGCRWSPKKESWYWHAGEYHRGGRRSYNMEDIRLRHGSVNIKSGQRFSKIA